MKKSCLVIMLSFFMALAFLSTNALSCSEGCTPGFWKNHHAEKNTDYWCADFSIDSSYNDVFGVEAIWADNPTLLEALKCGGGGEKALARHAVAALLNACSPDVLGLGESDSELGMSLVIEWVQDAYANENFEYWKMCLPDTTKITNAPYKVVHASTLRFFFEV